MIVTVGSVRGAPGATSWALLLAAAWPELDLGGRVVLEADPDGGVLGARYGLGIDPGAVSLIAALRHDSHVRVEAHARRVGDVWLVPGPESAEEARAVWRSGAEPTAERLAADRRVWFVDAGRLNDANPCRAFAQRSAVTVLVANGRAEDLVQVPSKLSTLHDNIVVLVVGGDYAQPEIAQFLLTPKVWTVDAAADLPVLAGRLLGEGRARRSWLWRQAVDIAAEIAATVRVAPSWQSDQLVGRA